jgi:hypothetical protein
MRSLLLYTEDGGSIFFRNVCNQLTRSDIQEDINIHSHRRGNLMSHNTCHLSQLKLSHCFKSHDMAIVYTTRGPCSFALTSQNNKTTSIVQQPWRIDQRAYDTQTILTPGTTARCLCLIDTYSGVGN